MPLRSNATFATLFAVVFAPFCMFGCSTAPEVEDRSKFIADARNAKRWLEDKVDGLSQQIDSSAAYAIFPGVGQWGILISGGKFGRGMLNRPDGTQIGWAAVNTASVGLQAGVQGFKMLVVFKDEQTLNQFRQNKLSGSVSGIVLVGETGTSQKASFENGVAIYQGANTGLLAGVNIGLDYMRYQPLGELNP